MEKEKLKTLKEIDLEIKECPKSEENNLINYLREERYRRLKSEVVKWVKEIRNITTVFDSNIFNPQDVPGAEKALMCIFNLTEEDLK